mgnify:FL=1
MIKFEDSELLNLLPVSMAKDIETQCISYALKRQVQNIIYFSSQTRTVAMIDLLPEHVLDALAVEMRTMYYSQDMSLEQKREIIKSTMKWYSKAGTPSAVEELIQVVFGEGKVTEWFDYQEGPYTPGTFDIETSAQLTFDMIARFNEIIKKVKNTRSHLRRIWVMRESEQQVYVGSIQAMMPHWIIEDEGLHYVRQAFYTACIMQPIATISIDGRR